MMSQGTQVGASKQSSANSNRLSSIQPTSFAVVCFFAQNSDLGLLYGHARQKQWHKRYDIVLHHICHDEAIATHNDDEHKHSLITQLVHNIVLPCNVMAHHWHCHQRQRSTNIHNLIFALSLMGDMPTNKARTSDNAQKQGASNAVPILFINSKYT